MPHIIEIIEKINTNPTKKDIYEIIDLMKKNNYSQIIDFYKKNKKKYLYRGSKQNNNIYISRPKELRIPKDSSIINHIIYDNVFDFLNFKAKRTNSIFCTPSYGIAKNYGNVYVIFPKNNFNFLYSSNIKDLYLFNINRLVNIFITKYEDSFIIRSNKDFIFYILKRNKKDEAVDELIKIFNLDKNGKDYYKKIKIHFLIELVEKEINEKNKKYFYEWLKKYAENGLENKKIFNFYKNFFKKFYKNDNLENALKYKNTEILVSCEDFISINYDLIENYGVEI